MQMPSKSEEMMSPESGSEGEGMELETEMEAEPVDLAAVSDDDLMAEAKARGLV
jgi:hypothetical protein